MKIMPSSFGKLLSIASLLALSSIMAIPAMAATITFNFTGNVSQVHNQLSSQFNTSQTMSGQATVNQVGTGGVYSIQSFNVNIGGYTATMGSSGTGTVSIVDAASGKDQFLLNVNQPTGTSIGSPHPLSPNFFEIDLRGPATTFASNALPTTPPSLSSFTNLTSWRLVFGNGDGRAVSGIVTSLTAVPLPAAVILFGGGLVALAGLGAGSWRVRKNGLA